MSISQSNDAPLPVAPAQTSELGAQGASLLEIADVLGRKTLAMVKRYSHLVADRKAKVIGKMITTKGRSTLATVGPSPLRYLLRA